MHAAEPDTISETTPLSLLGKHTYWNTPPHILENCLEYELNSDEFCRARKLGLAQGEASILFVAVVKCQFAATYLAPSLNMFFKSSVGALNVYEIYPLFFWCPRPQHRRGDELEALFAKDVKRARMHHACPPICWNTAQDTFGQHGAHIFCHRFQRDRILGHNLDIPFAEQEPVRWCAQ